jgi:CheY-like chemotaxis protein
MALALLRMMAQVLIVDDEDIVTSVVRRALEKIGHKIRTANSGREADRIAAQLNRVDVLITNHHVPPETGREIAERLLRTHPEAKVVHVSGYPREFLESEGGLTPGSSFLQKPFGISQIQRLVSSILALPRVA